VPTDSGNIVQTLDELQSSVYPNIAPHFTNQKLLCERSILASKNDAVNVVNSTFLISCQVQQYHLNQLIVLLSKKIRLFSIPLNFYVL